MKTYNVLLPSILFDGLTDTSYGIINNEKGRFHIIDRVSFAGDTNDCRSSLINHDGYSSYILCIEAN